MTPAIKAMVEGCRRCYLGELHGGPLAFEGRKGATFLVLGASPSEAEDTSRWIWTGMAGKFMRRVMIQCGIPNSDVAWGHVVSCRIKSRSKSGGVPKSSDVDACSIIRQIQVKAVDPRVVVLAGATAMNAYRPDWKFADMVGWPFVMDGRLFVTIPHPAAATSHPDIEAQIKDTVRWARVRARGGEGELLNFDDWPDRCSVCRGEMAVYDEMGVPYCQVHGDLIGREQKQGVQMRLVG